ncbi:MAG: lytic murein transglycosylase [Burkholderiales bacterium]
MRPGHAILALLCALPLAAWAQSGRDACIAGLRAEAAARGIFADLAPDPTVLEALENQPEFKTPIWDYLAFLVDAERIADGRARLAEHAELLAEAERRYGVDRYAIVAIWGVESDYGRGLGTRPLLRSLATLACDGRRQKFFRGEFMATLKIHEAGDADAASLTGSWAGAFGHTQFMPSTFLRLAVDFDGDGRRDLVASIPDVIGSTANFLKRAGWASGEPWGYEVRLPRDYAGASGRRTRQALAAWAAAGIRRIDRAPLSGPGSGALLLPAGNRGPAFLVFRNFNAIYSYNAAESYALAIAHLSDRLRGARGFATPWPTDDRGLSRMERREVQELLLALGYDIGAVDGGIGPVTRAAIRRFEASAGLPEVGRAGARVLEALRAARQERR